MSLRVCVCVCVHIDIYPVMQGIMRMSPHSYDVSNLTYIPIGVRNRSLLCVGKLWLSRCACVGANIAIQEPISNNEAHNNGAAPHPR